MNIFKASMATTMSLDVKLLLFSVLLRRASFGLTNQVLTLFLEAAGISKTRVGVFMTLTLVGDTFISYLLAWYSDAIGRRMVMIIGCVLMLASGVVFAYSLDFWILLCAAILGVISTSGDETGPFKTVEEACLSHLSPAKGPSTHICHLRFLGHFGCRIRLFSLRFFGRFLEHPLEMALGEVLPRHFHRLLGNCVSQDGYSLLPKHIL